MSELLKSLLLKAQTVDTAAILVSNGSPDKYGQFEIVAGFGENKIFTNPTEINLHEDALKIGIVPYSFRKNYYESKSHLNDVYNWPEFYFFEPKEHLLLHRNGKIDSNFELNIDERNLVNQSKNYEFNSNIEKSSYLKNIEIIRNKIIEGDFYEMNYCIAFTSNEITETPEALFYEYNRLTQAPFAAFFKLNNNQYLLCASPERFIKKENNSLISQPIKGTRRRIKDDLELDKQQIEDLRNCEKERAENVMITDLVRNDLSKVCEAGTVKVPELCGIYSFSHVHQMISTIEGNLKPEIDFYQILKANFPMGSMTGAPKLEVMHNIDALEGFERGLYSGSIGYIYKNNFDLNVIIRSIQINKEKSKMGFHVGGAITFDSVAEKEYEECMNKAAGMFAVLNNHNNN